MSSFFGKKKAASANANAASSSKGTTTTTTIRHEIRRVARPAAATAASTAAVSAATSARPLQAHAPARTPRGPPADRFNLTPKPRPAQRSTPSSLAHKSRAATIRGGQKRKSASPAAPIFGSDDDNSSDSSHDDSSSSSSSRPAKGKRLKTCAPLLDTSRRVRAVDTWPSGDSLAQAEFEPVPDLIHGRDLCSGAYAKDYQPVLVDDGDSLQDSGVVTVQLQYPSPSAPETFALAEPNRSGDYRPIEDIVNTVVEVLKHHLPEAVSAPLLHPSDSGPNTTLEFRLRRAFRQKSSADFRDALDDYNRTVTTHLRDGQIAAHMDDWKSLPSPLPLDLVRRVLSQIYARTVSPRVEMLSRYANKENTYGELREPFASQIFRDVNLTSTDLFLDLGSGVGNVVLQAALEVGCRSYGVEMMDNPCTLADAQAAEFPRRARLWGLAPGPVKLWKGDFLDDALVSKLLSTADVVLVNNEVFGPDLNNALKDRLLDLKEGARLVSLKSFVPDGWKLAAHTRNDPIAVLEVRQRQFWSNWVSWKWEGGDYFVATKDSSRIERILGR